MASYPSNSRGKTTDRSTSWSEWTWHDDGYWISRRYNELGVFEYDYLYPELAPEQTPRTPGETDLQRSLYRNVEPSTGTSSSSDQLASYTTSPSAYQQEPTNYFNPGSNQGAANNTSNPLSPLTRTLSPNPNPDPLSLSQSQGTSSYSVGQQNYGRNDIGYMVQKTQGLTLVSSQAGNEQGTDMSISGQPNWQKDGGKIQNPQGIQPCEELDQRYHIVDSKKLDKFWRVGRVFMMLWTEPAGGYQDTLQMGKSRNGSHFSVTYLNGKAFSEIRRFVVIRKNYGNCICSPIHTYNGQATLKPNLPDASEHAMIHTSAHAPDLHVIKDSAGIIRQESLHKDPIRVIREGKDDDQDLKPTSRLNYSKIYTVENYVRVLNIGIVHPNSMESLEENSYVRPSGYSSQTSRGAPQRMASEDTTEDAQCSQTDVRSDHGERSGRGGKSKDDRRRKKDSSSTSTSKPSGSGKRR